MTATDTDEAKEELGVWRFEGGKIYQYVKSGALIPAGESVVVDTSVTTAALIGRQVVTVQSATGLIRGIAEVTLPNLGFGWVTKYGPATARVVTNANPGVALTSSSTTGVLSVWGVSNLDVAAIALQTGLSAGSAVFVQAL